MIETERLLIRRFNENDWLDLYEYLSDEEVVKFEPYGVFNMEDCKREAIRRSADKAFWAVCLKDSNKLIGNVFLSKGEFDTWELGYVFNSNFHNKGYATEASKALIFDIIKNHGARRIIAMCNPLNESSWKLLERLGLRREGHLIKNIYFKSDAQGQPIWSDTYEYGILASEWLRHCENSTPVKTTTVQLRPITENEFQLLVDWNAGKDENYLYQWAGHKAYHYPISYEQVKSQANEENSQTYIIFLDDKAVGSIELNSINPEQSSAKICRFILCDEVKNKGIGTLALSRLIKLAFTEMKLSKLFLNVFCYNINAIRCYGKCGFLVKEYHQGKDANQNSYMMELINNKENGTTANGI